MLYYHVNLNNSATQAITVIISVQLEERGKVIDASCSIAFIGTHS